MAVQTAVLRAAATTATCKRYVTSGGLGRELVTCNGRYEQLIKDMLTQKTAEKQPDELASPSRSSARQYAMPHQTNKAFANKNMKP